MPFLQLLPRLPVSVSAGSLSQPALTQPASLSASPGASARLSCTLSGGYSGGAYAMCWYQQKAGSPPRYLLRVKSDSHKNQGSGVPSRFSGSKDASTNAGLLLISGLQPEDEADYYCAGSDILSFINLMMQNKVIPKPFFTCVQQPDPQNTC
uniref:Immunoglobulin lambda variable 5-52 n=1 Tax=Moschus moschiferus TaxID=68415 RepID=A0A8C6EFE9_MOSMO